MKYFRTTLSRPSTRYVISGFVVFVLCVLVFGYLYVLRFLDGYAAYAVVAKQHRDAAFLIANEQNVVREELNRMLTDVLEESISKEDRLRKAKRGLELLSVSERGIDAVGEVGRVVDEGLLLLESRSHFFLLWWWHAAMRDVVTIAREQSLVIADIRGLSYRANFHTAQIFNRIVEDRGALTSAHIAELNNLVPKVEEQFDRRSNLYGELEALGDRMTYAIERLPH